MNRETAGEQQQFSVDDQNNLRPESTLYGQLKIPDVTDFPPQTISLVNRREVKKS